MKSCPECGYPLAGNETSCPECGYPIRNENETRAINPEYRETYHYAPPAPPTPPVQEAIPPMVSTPKETKDWANYIYECGVIFWNVLSRKYADAYGRASRREYWSFSLLTFLFFPTGIGFIILLIPWICVCIRRMHDINRCGWWCLVPIAFFFLCLKKSDETANNYGYPNPAQNMI